MKQSFDVLYALHEQFYSRWSSGVSIKPQDLFDFIVKVRDSSNSITAIEERNELRYILLFWASHLAGKGYDFPDIDIDTPDRRPAEVSLRKTKSISPHHSKGLNITHYESRILYLPAAFILSKHPVVPTGDLRAAVKRNIDRSNTRYIFILSGHLTKKQREKLRSGFYKLAKEAIADYDIVGAKPEHFMHFFSLLYSWDSYPYVFYDTRDQSGSRKVLALRGHKKGKPISDPYEEVPPSLASDFIRAVMARAPKELDIPTKLHNIKEEDIVEHAYDVLRTE